MVEAEAKEPEVSRWRRVLHRVPWRPVIGLGSMGLIIVGIWGLYGWQWAAIAAGLPVAGFYLFGEIVEVKNKLTVSNPREGS